MRKGIDYIGVGAGAVIIDDKGRLFLAKRGENARNEKHKWEFPGGAVEFGERLADALIREIREEYGFQISVERLLDVVDHIIPQERQHWVSPTFLCRIVSGTASILEPHKCEEIGWFLPEAIPLNELTIASRESFQSFRRYLSLHT